MNSKNSDEIVGMGCLTIGGCIVGLFILFSIVSSDNGIGLCIVIAAFTGILYCRYHFDGSNTKVDTEKQSSLGERSSFRNNVSNITKDNNIVENDSCIIKEKLNLSIMNSYEYKQELKKEKENELEALEEKKNAIEDNLKQLNSKKNHLLSCKDKPFFVSKKTYVNQKRHEIDSYEEEISKQELELNTIKFNIDNLKKVLKEWKYVLYEDTNPEFEELKESLEQWKKSEDIKGSINIRISGITEYQKKRDLSYVHVNVKPYAIRLKKYRFYIFPRSIWVYSDDDNLVGVFKPSALKCTLNITDKTNYDYTKRGFYSDLTIVSRNTSSRYSCKDGSSELRNNNYSMIEKVTYRECLFKMEICGIGYEFLVSSENNCKRLEQAISMYSKLKENKDKPPLLVDLLWRCSKDRNIRSIKKMIVKKKYT